MYNPLLSFFLLVKASLGLPSGWQISDLMYAGLGSSSTVMGLTTNPEGEIFSSGTLRENGKLSRWFIRSKLSNHWETKAEFSYSTERGTGGKSIRFDKKGTLFGLARAVDSKGSTHWYVRKWNTDGVGETSDDFMEFPTGYHYAYDLAVDEKDNVFVSGYTANNPDFALATQGSWIVRKLINEKNSHWVTADSIPFGSASGVAVDSKGNIYVSGSGGVMPPGGTTLGDTESYLLTRMSADKGLTWKTIDTFEYPGKQGGAISFFVDRADHLYAVGSGWKNTSGVRGWMIRRSDDGGLSWKMLPSFSLDLAKNSEAYQVVQNPKTGELAVVGYAVDSEGIYHWIVQKSADFGDSWVKVLDYKGLTGKGAYGHNVLYATDGTLYTAGFSYPNGTQVESIWTVLQLSN